MCLIFLQFTWKFTKKKTKYALFQIETEFDCLHKIEYSITDLEDADRLSLEIFIYFCKAQARSLIKNNNAAVAC